MKEWTKIIPAVFLAIALTSGCIFPEIGVTAAQIKANTLQSCENVKTYTFSLNGTGKLTRVNDRDAPTIEISIQGEGAVDLANKKLKFEMTSSYLLSPYGQTTFYIIDNVVYTKTGTPGFWRKQNITDSDRVWDFCDHMERQAELLEVSEVERLDDEMVNGVDCYVLGITPDLKKYLKMITDLIGMELPQIPDEGLYYLNWILDCSIKHWIAKDTHYIMKAYNKIATDTSFFSGVNRFFNNIYIPNVYFECYVFYDNYNADVDIELPEEAKNAPWQPTQEEIYPLYDRAKYYNGPKYIDGFVYDATGAPLYFAEIDISFPGLRCYTTTDENGYFNFSRYNRFPLGTYIVKASMGNLSVTLEVMGQRNMVPLEIPLPITAIPTGTVCGYITDFALNPIEGAWIYENIRGVSATTDENGFYCFENLTPGNLIFSFSAEGYKTAIKVQTVLWPGEPKKFHNFSFATIGDEPGGINGIIIDSTTGEPLEDVEVMILADGEIISKFTDEQGYYEFVNLTSNREYPLIAMKEGYRLADTFAEVSSKVTTRMDFKFLPLATGTCIAGFLIDETGHPVKEARVEVSRNGGYTYHPANGGLYSLGYFDIKPFLPTKLRVKISAEGYQTLEEDITITQGQPLVKHYILTKS